MYVFWPPGLLGSLAVVCIHLLFLFHLSLICFSLLLLLLLLLCPQPDILPLLPLVLSLLSPVLLLLPVKVLVGVGPGEDRPKPLLGQDMLLDP